MIRNGKRTGSTCVYHKSRPDCAPVILMDGKRNIKMVIPHISSLDRMFLENERTDRVGIVLSVFLKFYDENAIIIP